jgi:hypothetical protein
MQLIRYNEPMEHEELDFLIRKERKESAQLYKAAKIIMWVCFLLPFAIAWFRAVSGATNPFAYRYYFLSVGFLLCFSAFCLYVGYRRTLFFIREDIKHGTKTIEYTHITKKQYMPQTNSFYFYLDSPNKLSIEVKEYDYNSKEQGDELNIEYTTYSKQYLGYF